MIGTAHDIMSKVAPPRAVFVDHPVGRAFGPPHDRRRNQTVLARVLEELPKFAQPRELRDPGFQWAADGSRSWENELRAEMAHDR